MEPDQQSCDTWGQGRQGRTLGASLRRLLLVEVAVVGVVLLVVRGGVVIRSLRAAQRSPG